MQENQSWIVKNSSSLLDFLHSRLGGSKKAIKRALEQGVCRRNGQIERFGSVKVLAGETIEFTPRELASRPLFKVSEVLFSDEALVIYNKPTGLSSDGQGVLALLTPHLGPLYLTHRLDKETSGALLLARTAEYAKRLQRAFAEREVEKKYLAWVEGEVAQNKGNIQKPLGPVGYFHGQTLYGVVEEGGKSAQTYFQVEKREKQRTLLICSPQTGRTHQLRVHLASMGHPIVGDLLYNRAGSSATRLLLHAWKLQFLHPITGVKISVEAPCAF